MNEVIPVLLKVPSTHHSFSDIADLVSLTMWQHRLQFRFVPVGVVLTEDDLVAIYPHLPAVILNAQLAQFANRSLGLWIVTGDDAIEKVTQLKGSENDPELCAPDTWRYQIGKLIGNRLMSLRDGDSRVVTYDNFIHAPKRAEVDRDLAILKKFA